MKLGVTPLQYRFMTTTADEVLFGGAAGGGKSQGQIRDALWFALKYPGSRQLLLRRTYPELERSLILDHLALYPAELYKYNSAAHRGRFVNGSIVEFGFCDTEKDVYKYQSAEYDVIRFDELTHFTEGMYTYLTSRVRGANPYPKQVKSTTNPGGVGHYWVKARFVDPAPPNTEFYDHDLSRIFIPALLEDNSFLAKSDPNYRKRLLALGDRDRKSLLEGRWDIEDGRYFTDWSTNLHVIKPFAVPQEWARYVTMDYGLDMLAAYVIAMEPDGRAVVMREAYVSGLIISRAAKAVLDLIGSDRPVCVLAPPDLWNRRQEMGRSAAEIFAENGLPLTKASNERISGWYDLAEWLRPRTDEFGEQRPGIRVFDNCRNLITTLPALSRSEGDPNDASTEPHELTHAPDALRYFCAGRPRPTEPIPDEDHSIRRLLNFK